jgi:hypothetical protein
VHVLRLAEGFQPLDAQLAPDAALAHAAERAASLSVSGSFTQNVPALISSMACIT